MRRYLLTEEGDKKIKEKTRSKEEGNHIA